MIKVNLRKFSETDLERVLSWRGHREAVLVTDDFGKTVESDTYALMLTHVGLVINRKYPKVKYSVDQLVPSSKVGDKHTVVYNNATLSKPINYALKEVMPEIDCPIENDNIKLMVYNWQCILNNVITVMSEESIVSARAEDVAELHDDKGIAEIRDKVRNREVSIDEGEELFETYLRESASLDYNVMALLTRTGGVSINQAYQTVVVRGAVFDLNNTILPNPIMDNYAGGIGNVADNLGDSRSSGKAETVSTPIKIPNGWKKMGDIQVGDQVIHPSGYPTNVTHVHPQGVTKVLRVLFEDGRYSDVNPEHLWKISGLTEDAEWEVETTANLVTRINSGEELGIPFCVSEQNEDKEFETEPPLAHILSGGKGIPKEYLFGSTNQRLDALLGIMNSQMIKKNDPLLDEDVDDKYSYWYSTSKHKEMAEDIQYLARSLGLFAKLTKGESSWNLLIRKPTEGVNKLKIVGIEERPDEETKCITVDHPDHLYVSNNFVVTHNSLISNGRGLKDSEWFHRKTNIFSSPMQGIDHLVDCGTKSYLPMTITCKEMTRSLLGFFYLDEEDQTEKIVTNETVKKTKAGTILKLRSAAFCNHPKPGTVCGKCFGKMKSNIPYNVMTKRDANIGLYSSTTICNPIGQKMLSTKHFIRNAITKAFEVYHKDIDILTTNGDEIFLKEDIIREGTKMILKSSIVKDLSDYRSLDTLDEVTMDKLPNLPEVTFEYEIEDIMIGGTTTQRHSCRTSISSRQARFSLGFLQFLMDSELEVQDRKFVVVDLKDWNHSEPIFSLPYTREDLDQHRARVENFLTFNKRNTAWKRQVVTPKVFADTLSEFWTLINSETKGINMVYLEVVLAAALTKDPENGSYQLALGEQEKYFSSFISCIENRGVGQMMIFEKQQLYLNSPKSFLIKDRQGSPLECFFQHAVN